MSPADGSSNPVEWRRSTCPHDCPSACSLEVERLASGRIGRVRGDEEQDYTAGVVCAKVARYAERIHHPDRLTRPLVRIGAKGEGRFMPVSWDEALDRVADAFKAAAARHGSEAVWPYYFAGTMGLVQRDGINRLRHAMRYSGQQNTICSTLARTGYAAGTGAIRGADPREIEESDLVVVWGANPVSTQVNLMTHISRARKSRGAKLVVVDPYRTPTAEVADLHLRLRPGTDAALACGMMHVLFREGLADREYIAQYTSGAAELEAHLETRGPAWAESVCGVPAATIEEAARLWGRTARAFLRLGYGFSRSRNGVVNMHAASCLPAVTGAWRHKGGGALFANWDLYDYDRRVIEGLDVRDARVRSLDMSRLGPVLVGEAAALKGGPPVTAMIVQNTNPALVCPESAKVRAGLMREDLFLCVHEQFMTDTARLADVVLPATTFLEHDDVYLGGGHTYVSLGLKMVEPPGECRSNHEVISALAHRLGASHRGFGMTARELVVDTCRRAGWDRLAALDGTNAQDCALPFERAHFLDGFATRDRRFHFAPEWRRFGPDGDRLPSLPDHWEVIEAADETHPFRLVTAPARSFLNSSFTETPGSQAREGRPTAMIHPHDAAPLGLADGDLVRLGNARGSVLLHAKVFDGLERGTIVVETLHPNASYIEGIGINVLIGADAALPAGGAVFHDSAVWARAER
jgi:anaerobic selenocysteine-containing dehydrogenase